MAVEGYNEDRGAVAQPDTWGSTFRDTGLAGVGGLARGAGEVGQALGAKEFAEAMRGVERGAEEQTSETGKEVAKAAFIPTEEGETSVFKHPVRSALHGAVNLATSLPVFLAGAGAGTLVGGPVGGVVGGTLAGAGQGFGAAEYEARKRVEGMTPEQRHQMKPFADVLAQGGSEEDATEALVTALHPSSAEIMHTIGGGLPGGAMTHGLQRNIGKTMAQSIAAGITPKALPQIGAHMGEQALALGVSSGLGEAGRQAGEINIGAQVGYDPLKIGKAGFEGAVPGALFGAHTGVAGWRGGARRAGTARAQFDRLWDEAHGLKESLQSAFPGNEAGSIGGAPAGAAPIGEAADPAVVLAAKSSSATGGGGPAHEAKVHEITDAAHAAGEQVAEQGGTKVGEQVAEAPPVAGAGAERVSPEEQADIAASQARDAEMEQQRQAQVAEATAKAEALAKEQMGGAEQAPTPTAPVKPTESWDAFQQRMMEGARQGQTREFLSNEFKLWKEANPDQPRSGHNRLHEMAGDARAAWKVAEAKRATEREEAGKRMAAEEAARDAVTEAAAKVQRDAEAKALQEGQVARDNVLARDKVEGAAQETEAGKLGYIDDPMALAKKQAEGFAGLATKEAKKKATLDAAAAAVKAQAERLTNKGGKRKVTTVVTEPVKPEVTRVAEGTSGVVKPNEGKRTKEADAAVRGAEAVESALQASERLMEEAKAEHAQKVKDGAEERAAARAAGKPVKFKAVDSVDTIHARLLEEHRQATLKAEAEANAKAAKKAREVRKDVTEGKEELARDAAFAHIENLSEDHATHLTEENAAVASKSGSERDAARTRVVERARKLVSDIENKIKAEISGTAKWSKEGAVVQNLMNALRDTKDMIDRWDAHRRGEGKTQQTRDTRLKKLNQDFVDHLETMYYLREGNIEDLGKRRQERSAEMTRQKKEGKGSEGQREGTERRGTEKKGKEEREEGADTEIEKVAEGARDEREARDEFGEETVGERAEDADPTEADTISLEELSEEAKAKQELHGDFTEVSGDDDMHAASRTTDFIVNYKSDPNGPVTLKRRVRVPVLERLTGHGALKIAQNLLKKMLDDAKVGRLFDRERSDVDVAHIHQLQEWSNRLRLVVPHVRMEVISDADFDLLMLSRGEDAGSSGVHIRNKAEVESDMSGGRILIPERTALAENAKDQAWLVHVIMHEYGHAATLQALAHDAPYRRAMTSLYDAFKAVAVVKKGGMGEYALSKLEEFATEAPINRELAGQLAKLEAPPDVVAYVQGLPKPTIKLNMWQAFAGMLARYLKFQKPTMSMMEAVTRMNEFVMDKQQEINARGSERFASADATRSLSDMGGLTGTGHGEVHAIRMPTGGDIRKGFINQMARGKVSGQTFNDRWKAVMLNVKTTVQIAQGLDRLFGKLSDLAKPDASGKFSTIAKRALDLMPDDMRASLADKPLSRAYVELQQRMNARIDTILNLGGGEKLTHDSYKMQRKFGLEGTSPDGNGSMWDFYTRFMHDETTGGAFWGGEKNDHLDPANLDHAQSLARLADGTARWAKLDKELQSFRIREHDYYRKSQKAMSDFLSDNTVDELTDMIRHTENLKATKAPIFDRAGMEDFKQWLKDKRPDTHPHNDLYKDILAEGPAAKRLKEIRELAEIAGPYIPLMRKGDYHHTGYHELTDAPGQLRRMDKSGETFDAANPEHAGRAHEFNTYEFADEKTAKPFIEGHDFKAMGTGEKLVNKTTNKVESVPQPRKLPSAPGTPATFETNYGGKHEIHATRADGIKARDAFIATNYHRRIHTTLQNKEVNFYRNAVDLEIGRRETEATPGFTTTEAGHRKYEPTDHTDDISDSIRSIKAGMESSTGFAKLDSADKQVMRDLLSQHSLRVLGGTRVQSRRLPRKNVLGASHDLSSNLAEYAHSHAGYVARLEFGPHIGRVVEAMREQVKTKGADKDAFLRSAVMNEFDKRRDTPMNPANDGVTGKVINRLLQLSFLKRLASPAFHVINSQEPWMLGLPYFAGEHGLWKSGQMMVRAYNAIGGRDIAWQGIKETGRAFTHDETMDFGGRIRDKFTKGSEEQWVLDHLMDRGMIGRDSGMELQRLNTADSNLVGRGIDRADHVSRQMGQAVEGINRSVVGLTAFWLAKEKHPTWSRERLAEYAAEAIDNTMGTYDRWNAPPIFNHPIGRLALQFHKYGQRQYYLLGKMVGGSLKGDNKLQNAKSLGLMMGTHFIMAGALGLPTEPITMAINVANSMGLTDETSETFNNAIRETLSAHFGKDIGQLTAMGVPSYFGIDTNSRMGLNQLLGPFGAPKSHKAEDIFTYYAKWMAGSAPGMVAEHLSGLGDLAAGNYGDAATKLGPLKVAGDSAKGLLGVAHGKVSPSGRAAGDAMTPFEGAMQAIGFAPSRLREGSAAKNYIYQGTQDYSKERTGLSGKWVSAKTTEDEVRAWDAIQRFNAQQTSNNAKITKSDLYKQRRSAKKAEDEASAKGLPVGARLNKRVPEVAERAKATFNY